MERTDMLQVYRIINTFDKVNKAVILEGRFHRPGVNPTNFSKEELKTKVLKIVLIGINAGISTDLNCK